MLLMQTMNFGLAAVW